MPLLFSYGTLQQDEVQVATFGKLLHGQRDELVGFEQSVLSISDPYVVETSGKTEHLIVSFTGDDQNRVSGMVFEITDDELARADEYEVREYSRITVELASGRQAWVYVDARVADPS